MSTNSSQVGVALLLVNILGEKCVKPTCERHVDCCRAVKMKEKPELLVSTVAFFSFRLDLRVELVGANRWGVWRGEVR